MTSEAKEHVQTIVWIIEAVTLFTTALIALAVWRASKRASKRASGSKKAEPHD